MEKERNLGGKKKRTRRRKKRDEGGECTGDTMLCRQTHISVKFQCFVCDHGFFTYMYLFKQLYTVQLQKNQKICTFVKGKVQGFEVCEREMTIEMTDK